MFSELQREMSDIECNDLSAEGIKSYDYVRWKEETLAKQTSHKVKTYFPYQDENILKSFKNLKLLL